MPTFFRMTDEEVAARTRPKAKPRVDLEPYRTFLRTLQPGEWARMRLHQGESQRTIRRRITTAARQLGLKVKHRKSDDVGNLYFVVQVAKHEQEAAA